MNDLQIILDLWWLYLIVGYPLFTIFNTLIAQDYNIGWFKALIYSLFLTPWIAAICVFASGKKLVS
ncbi:hypothetical protein FAM09_24895 [Niastella caeni]|uniref:Uncharacterized protein n=1 Tax=Niastella caeni TaxID=2569763 RepID=A0A4S8HGI2_9BACT|nr:hypothetical protein [Niastella caeni]THU34260.1 hypothetical protein FAM09_24895 [Niastella caeni]